MTYKRKLNYCLRPSWVQVRLHGYIWKIRAHVIIFNEYWILQCIWADALGQISLTICCIIYVISDWEFNESIAYMLPCNTRNVFPLVASITLGLSFKQCLIWSFPVLSLWTRDRQSPNSRTTIIKDTTPVPINHSPNKPASPHHHYSHQTEHYSSG